MSAAARSSQTQTCGNLPHVLPEGVTKAWSRRVNRLIDRSQLWAVDVAMAPRRVSCKALDPDHLRISAVEWTTQALDIARATVSRLALVLGIPSAIHLKTHSWCSRPLAP